MNVAVRTAMTVAEFLAWEERQEFKHEFDGFRPVAMAGGTAAHARIQRNLAIAVGGRLRGNQREFYGSDLKIEVAGSIRYPDGFVVCTPAPPRSTVVRDPVVIFEVLSEGTTNTDIVTKNREYAATPSVQGYVILSQLAQGGMMFERIAGDWVGHDVAADAVLRMPEIGMEVPLAEFYEGIDFTAEDAPA